MTKYEWDRQFRKAIAGLPANEQKRVIDYYNELFADKIDDRMTEREIIEEFGNPYDVANKLLVDYYNDGRSSDADEYVFSEPDSAFDEPKRPYRGGDRPFGFNGNADGRTKEPFGSRRRNPDDFERNRFSDTRDKSRPEPASFFSKSRDERDTYNDRREYGEHEHGGERARPATFEPARETSGGNRFETSSERTPAKFETLNNNKKSMGAICSTISILTVILFFIMGACFNAWHPAWMLFLLIPVITSFVDAVNHRSWKRFNYPLLVVFLYLVLGFYCHMWHPSWIMFLTIPLYYVLTPSPKHGKEGNNNKKFEKSARDEVKREPEVGVYDRKPAEFTEKKKHGSVVGGIVVTILLVCIAIIVWALVISLFIAGVGMMAGGIGALIISITHFAVSFDEAMFLLGAALIVMGLGFIFTFGFASLFKPSGRMCKAFGRNIKRQFTGE